MHVNDRKEIVKNLISLGSLDILSLLIPLLTMPILTRALGVSKYSEFLLFVTILAFGQTVVDFGVNFVGIRDVSKTINCSEKIRRKYTEYQTIRFLFLIIYIALLIVYFYFSMGSVIYNIQFIIPYFLGYILLSSWFYQAINKANILLCFTLLIQITIAIYIVFFINEKTSLEMLKYSYSYSYLFIGMLSFSYIYLKYRVDVLCFNTCIIKNKISNGYKVFIGILAPNLYNSLPFIIVGGIYSSSEFSSYAIAMKICGVLFTIQNVISKSIYPVISRTSSIKVGSIIKSNLLVSLPFVFIFYFFSNPILEFVLNIELYNTFYIKVLLLSMIFVGLANSLTSGYFLPNKLDNEYRNISLRVSLISAIITIILVSLYGIFGCAIGLFIARFLLFVDYFITYRKLVIKGV
ncbi:oligosaccharide flippase family protein [Photobacterium damselae]|nr:oligosaccharide flippase family protein [Photobacterium damselae]